MKSKLLGEEQRLEKELKDLDPKRLARNVDSPDEEADIVEDETIRFATAQTLKGRLKNVQTALDKMSDENYGRCENCGKPIELNLLEVNPESKLCRECKLKSA